MEMLIGTYTQGDIVVFLVITIRTLVLLSGLGVISYVIKRPCPWAPRFMKRSTLTIAILYIALQSAREINQSTQASIRWTNDLQAKVDSLKK